MRIIDNDHLQQLIDSDTVKRLVVLRNNRKGKTVAAWFVGGYDNPQSLSTVEKLFDTTFDTIDWSSQSLFSAESIPLVSFLGQYRVSVVTKLVNGNVVIVDGELVSLDAMMGLG